MRKNWLLYPSKQSSFFMPIISNKWYNSNRILAFLKKDIYENINYNFGDDWNCIRE